MPHDLTHGSGPDLSICVFDQIRDNQFFAGQTKQTAMRHFVTLYVV